jgi:hypothetical protein
VTVRNVKDQMIPASTIASGASATFQSWTLAQGILRFEHYDKLGGAGDGDITTALADPRVVAGTPTTLGSLVGSFNTRTFFADDSHESYLARITGFITPTVSGDYDFFLRSDDAGRLYLSKDETAPNPAVDTPIANEPGCCNAFKEPGATQTTASPISLVAGKKYAVLALLKEAGGGDYLQVAWRKTTDTTEAASLQPMAGTYFASYVDPNAEIAFTTQPVDQEGSLPSASINFASLNFLTSSGSFGITNTTPEPPGPWAYDAASGGWVANGSDSGCGGPYNSQLYSTTFTVPDSQAVTLTFNHRYSFEADGSGGYDGGQVLVSVNGGAFKAVPADSFTLNGYSKSKIVGNGVLKDQLTFTGDSAGYKQGTFITSSALLGTFTKGDKIVIEFLGAWDDCSTATNPNWVIRDMALTYSTTPVAVTFTAAAKSSRQGTPTTTSYQWQRNDGAGFVDLAGETAASYRFFPTVAADLTATFRVLAGVPGNLVPSAAVKVVAPNSTPTLSVGTTGGKISITYTGTLQSAPAVTGPFTPVTGATSPYVPTVSGTQFFRSVK